MSPERVRSDGFPRPRAAEDRLSDLLKRQAAMVTGERFTLGDMAEFLGERSIGGLLLILALPMALPVPAPGISVLFGVPLIVISAQLALGYRRAWLPARLSQRSVSRAAFLAIVDRMLPPLRRLERIVRGWPAPGRRCRLASFALCWQSSSPCLCPWVMWSREPPSPYSRSGSSNATVSRLLLEYSLRFSDWRSSSSLRPASLTPHACGRADG
jgi:hypothetical protein